MWNCVCDCGNRKTIRETSLLGGDTRSCGCFQKEGIAARARKHGGFGTRLYAIWNSMRQRCLNENHYAYHNYGGRGITICDEWNDYNTFRDWAISSGYRDDAERGEFTLDRIDVNGSYSPDNCRWANMKEQSRNKRDTVLIPFYGEVKPLIEIAEELGVEYTTAWKRYKNGLPIKEVFRK